ncbi:hypothetical protein BFP76_01930 [Amylibacter kogurei]|uniref:Tetratrico peptide repeat group 5 domain-containing protein n=1 Tax=Paramylibacter kogurei TaxID=1889778 RepID=A0A2G5K4T8_9RHOB|nr:tetratricopeptide repeat protein [Amylibacter kogurei]PIB24033.1 hypothetical protein BFP76_01930 [Amylibacter kogurei]
MRKFLFSTVAIIASSTLLVACDKNSKSKEEKTVVGVVDETNLNDIMLTMADPNEAAAYFRDASVKDPERIDLKRGLAKSLVRAKRNEEAVLVYEKLVNEEKSVSQDRIDFAGALISSNQWKRAAEQLNLVPPTVETYQRYRFEAMIADSQQKWKKADSFYETAAGLTTQPSGILNNWGYSKFVRGDYKAAEKLYLEAITYDPKLFTAKNNLVMARAQRGEFALPIIQMTEIERAELTYTAGLSAIKQGKIDIGRGMVEEAIDLHPRHFAAAVDTLKALNKNVVR